MAISDSLRSSFRFTQSANKSISSAKTEILKSNISVNKINQVISSNIKLKETIAYKSNILDLRRRENEKRKIIEDRIEASKVSTNTFKASASMISNSSAGPFQRLLGFLGFITAGWLVENLPTIIFIGKEFISRVYKMGSIISNFLGGMITIVQRFGTLLHSVGSNILNLDFTDQSNRVRTSLTELNDAIESVNREILEGYSLLTTPLTQSIDTGEEAPLPGQPAPDTLYPEPYQPGETKEPETSGGRVSPQAVYSYLRQKGISHAHAMGILANIEGESKFRVGAKSGDDGGAGGLFQWKKPRSDRMAANVPNWQRNWKGQLDYALVEDAGPAYLKTQFSSPEDAAQWWMVKWERPSERVRGARKQQHNAFIRNFKPSGQSQPPKTPTPTPTPPRPVSTGTMNLIPQTGSGGLIQGGSGKGGETTYATHFHIDAKTANPTAQQLANIREVAFRAAKAMFARGSWIHFGNIKKNADKNTDDQKLKGLISAEQKAHGARSSAAVDIQEHNPNVKQTFPSQVGSATKFPFAVGEVYYRGGYGREAEIIGTGGITVSHGAPGSKATEGVSQQKTSTLYPVVKSQIPQSITPERKGQQIVVVDPPAPTPQQVVSATMPKPQKQIQGQFLNELNVLNRFIKQKILLDLSYL
jgi:hypothetical protein